MFLGICNVLRYPENYAILKLLELSAPGLLNVVYVGCFVLLTVIGVVLIRGLKAEAWIAKYGHTTPGLLCMATLFTWSFLSLSQVSVFLYFDF